MSPTPPAPPLSRLLEHAADAVAAVLAGRSLTDALIQVPPQLRPGTQAIAFQAMRRLGVARAARQSLAPRRPAPWVEALLVAALALAWPTGEVPAYAEHTLVDQAVRAARRRSPDAAGFVNALLRRFLREQVALVAAVEGRQPEASNHPGWWIEQLRRDWPDQWQALLATNQTHPPMMLRVNRRRGLDAATYAERLAAAGIDAVVLGTHALQLASPQPVHVLPGFADGDVSVQDLNAQRAAPLLLGLSPPDSGVTLAETAPPRTARVLDACAAPGGKTAHLLELADVELTALDRDAQRLQRVGESLSRLGLSGVKGRTMLNAADAREPASWWDGRPFDAILIDAPCSGSGVVRRHPDIRWLRRADDLPAMAQMQAELLDALWPLLAPGGRMLYATCSVFRIEGQAVIDAFLQRTAAPGPRLDPASPGHLLPLADNLPKEGMTTPSAAVGDGFFYALMHKPL